jgi:hypothetical protein
VKYFGQIILDIVFVEDLQNPGSAEYISLVNTLINLVSIKFSRVKFLIMIVEIVSCIFLDFPIVFGQQ